MTRGDLFFLLQGKSSGPWINSASQASTMLRHFALLLLFCSLISLAVSTDTTETNPDVHGAQVLLREEVDALEHGRIVAVKPIHFLVSRHYTVANVIVQ